MRHRYALTLLSLCLASLLGGCGFVAAPIAGTATTAAQLTVKGADKGIHYSKVAAKNVVEAAGNVSSAAANGLRPVTSEELDARQTGASHRAQPD